METITVTLDDETAAWLAAYAANRKMSPSDVLHEILRGKNAELRDYERSMQRFLSIEPKNLSNGTPYPRRDALYKS